MGRLEGALPGVGRLRLGAQGAGLAGSDGLTEDVGME